MKTSKIISFFLPILMTGIIHAIEPTAPINFGGGVDYKNTCTEISDNRACDSSNMIANRYGGAFTRPGSRRLVDQVISTEPINSLFRAYISSANIVTKVTMATSGDSIYYSTSEARPAWIKLYGGLKTRNQQFSYAVAQNRIYMTGNALTDPIFVWDIMQSSFTTPFLGVYASSGVNFYAKYLLYDRNYMLAANIRDVRDLALTGNSTYYDDRLYYSLIFQPSSFTANRFLNFQIGDAEYISGMTKKFGRDEIYKQSLIQELSFTQLDPVAEGGDQVITPIVKGFGNITDTPPQDIGDFDAMFSRDGIIIWDGGRKQRINLEAEKLIISKAIQPIIDKIVRNNLYKSVLLQYYPKNQQLVMAYEDPESFPRGRRNRVLVYDIITQEWWPFKNWLIGSMAPLDGADDSGQLMYGDSNDGYVYVTDELTKTDDARKEISIDNMDNPAQWARATTSLNPVIEGTASLKILLDGGLAFSSISKLGVIQAGEWYDKTKVTKDDKLSFKVFADSISNISNIRVDILYDDARTYFSENFSSVTFSSSALTSGNTAWSTIEVKLSSFPIKSEWVDISSAALPYSKGLTWYGLRFCSTATGDAALYIDDVRIVQNGQNPLSPYRLSKQWNFGSIAEKDFRQIVLTRDKQRDSSMSIDVFTGLGNLVNTKNLPQDIGREIYVFGFNGSTGMSKIDGDTFEVIASSENDYAELNNGTADSKYIYTSDTFQNNIIKVDKNAFNSLVSTYGSLGSNTSNFSYVQDIAADSDDLGNLYIVDHDNNRIKVHKKKDLVFVAQYGTLGTGTTSFYDPTGVDIDGKYAYVGDDTNQRIVKFTKSTFGYVSEAALDMNTLGNISVKIDDSYLYDAYNRGSDNAIYFIDVALEKRNKGDLSLVNRVPIFPKDVTTSSTYTLTGIALRGKNIYVAFADSVIGNKTFYIQQRLKDSFALVNEYKSNKELFGIAGDGLARESSKRPEKINLNVSQDSYLQLKFRSEGTGNGFGLLNISFVAEPKQYQG